MILRTVTGWASARGFAAAGLAVVLATMLYSTGCRVAFASCHDSGSHVMACCHGPGPCADEEVLAAPGRTTTSTAPAWNPGSVLPAVDKLVGVFWSHTPDPIQPPDRLFYPRIALNLLNVKFSE